MKKRFSEQLDYGDRPERMSSKLEKKYSDPESYYAKNPAMRKGSKDVERLASSRFQKIAKKLSQVLGVQDLTASDIKSMLIGEMMSNANAAMRIEQSHKRQLEQLAVTAAIEESEINPDWYEIEAHLDMPRDLSGFQFKPGQKKEKPKMDSPSFEDMSFDVSELSDDELLELEKAKRDIINSIIQGSATRGHYLFQKPDIKSRLDRINPNLYRHYLVSMSIVDYIYFSGDIDYDAMAQSGAGLGGTVRLANTNDDDDDDMDGDDMGGEEGADTRIIAYGAFFPILCHEILKGIEEARGRYGLPTEPTMRHNVQAQADLIGHEPDQIRIGPEIVGAIRQALPDEMFDPRNKGLVNWFYIQFYQLEAEDFLRVIGNAISDDQNKVRLAKDRFYEIMKEAQKLMREYYEWAEENDTTPESQSDDDILDFLDDLGIDLPPDLF